MSLFLLYFITVRPFNSHLHNLRSGFIHCSEWAVLLVSAYYNDDSGSKVHSHVPAQAILGILLTCVIGSFGVLVLEIYKFVKKMLKKYRNNKVENEDK